MQNIDPGHDKDLFESDCTQRGYAIDSLSEIWRQSFQQGHGHTNSGQTKNTFFHYNKSRFCIMKKKSGPYSILYKSLKNYIE